MKILDLDGVKKLIEKLKDFFATNYVKKVGNMPSSGMDVVISPTSLTSSDIADYGGGIHVKAYTGTPFQLWLHDISNVWYKKTNNNGWVKMDAGNADTATKLATARTLTIGNTGKTFDGSANVSWSLSDIGAAASSHTHTFASLTSKPTTLSGYGITDASASSHTHKVKINGTEKTIAASSGSAVDLGTYLTSHQSLANCVQTIKTSGSGSIVANITKSGSTLTVTKVSNSVDWSEVNNTPDNFQSYGILNYVELPFLTTDVMNFQGNPERVAIKVSADNASQYLTGQAHPIRFLAFADGCTFTRIGTCINNVDLPVFTGTVVDQMQGIDDMVAWLSYDGSNFYLIFDGKDNAVNCLDETYTPTSSELVNSWE